MLTFESSLQLLLVLQIIDSFTDSVMSVCLTKTEMIGGSVDGTVRTFDIRIGRYVALSKLVISWLVKRIFKNHSVWCF